MSENPFRASQSHVTHPAATAPIGSYINADADVDADSSSSDDGITQKWDLGNASLPPQQPAKTKKSVRIESPTTSEPDPGLRDPLVSRIIPGKHAGSPPPTPPVGFSDSFENTYPVDPSTVGGDKNVERGIAGSSRRDSDMVGPVHSPPAAPANPFSRTLATIESQEKRGAELAHSAGHSRDRTAADKPGSRISRANLDVEGFKRLLMTGISSPPASGQPSQPSPAPASNPSGASVFESSSSTDTSSVSRQSIFEPAVQEPHVETPRTSYEMAPSDDETVGLVSDTKKTEKKKPPPAPKHRHGKLVTARTPQIVAFSEFSASEASLSPISRNRTNSDLNKPLPAVPFINSPPAHIVSQDKSQDEPQPPPLETKDSSSSGRSDPPPTPQKRVPPPVPLARRQSQLRTSSNRSRSNSNLTLSSQHSTEFPLLSPAPTSDANTTSTHKTPPPPPPTRRHGNSLTSGNPPSATSSTTELPSTASLHRQPISSPDPPTSRKSTFSSPPPSPSSRPVGLSRTPSVNSNRTQPRTVSNESTGMPPPPPPPRRRQSGRSSLDKERPLHISSTSPAESRRTSSENKRSSIDGKRRTSVASESSLRYEYAPSTGDENVLYSPKEEAEEPRSLEPVTIEKTDSSNVLDEMERFQKEIDELRERYQKGS